MDVLARDDDAVAALFAFAQQRWGWGNDEYEDVRAAVNVVVEALGPATTEGAVDLLRDAHDRDRIDGSMPSIDWYKRVDAFLNPPGGQ